VHVSRTGGNYARYVSGGCAVRFNVLGVTACHSHPVTMRVLPLCAGAPR